MRHRGHRGPLGEPDQGGAQPDLAAPGGEAHPRLALEGPGQRPRGGAQLRRPPCPRPRDLIDPLLASGPLGIDYACRLELSPRSLAELEITAWRHLEAVAPTPDLAAELDRILDEGRLHGCTDAGTLLLTARFP